LATNIITATRLDQQLQHQQQHHELLQYAEVRLLRLKYLENEMCGNFQKLWRKMWMKKIMHWCLGNLALATLKWKASCRFPQPWPTA